MRPPACARCGAFAPLVEGVCAPCLPRVRAAQEEARARWSFFAAWSLMLPFGAVLLALDLARTPGGRWLGGAGVLVACVLGWAASVQARVRARSARERWASTGALALNAGLCLLALGALAWRR